ncbi:MAG: hypothetical protein ABW068_15305 [Candidatus Thiodiazotropha sp.]
MNWLIRLFRNAPVPIAIKWTIYIGTLITLVMGLLGWFLITQQTNFHLREVRGFGKVLVEQLAHSASEPLLADDQFNLLGLVSRQTQNDNVVGAAIVPADKPWVISGNVPHQLPTNKDLSPMIWAWRDEENRRHAAITFFSPITFQASLRSHERFWDIQVHQNRFDL